MWPRSCKRIPYLLNFCRRFSSPSNAATRSLMNFEEKNAQGYIRSITKPHKILILEDFRFYMVDNIEKITGKVSARRTELKNFEEQISSCHHLLEASGNGLVCLRKRNIDDAEYYFATREQKTIDTTTTFIVCNPLTGEWISVPVFVPAGQYAEVLCLYFHSSSSEHRMLLRFKDLIFKECPASYVVVTLGPNTMRTIKNPAFETWKGSDYASDGPVLLHGYLHWLGVRGYGYEYKLLIVLYNLETEQFTYISPPENFQLRYIHLIPIDGKLCILDEDTNYYNRYDLWVLADYEKGIWIKKNRVFVKMISKDNGGKKQTYLPVNRDFPGDILLVKHGVHDVVNPEKKLTFYSLGDEAETIPNFSYDTIDYYYNESLASIRGN